MEVNNCNIIKYYTICSICQLVWNVGVLGFAIALLLILKTPFVLFSVGLVFIKPYEVLVHRRLKDLQEKEDKNNGC